MKGINVLFEDDDLLVLDKPAGLPVQGGAGVETSLDSLLAERRPRPLLVHRLDRDTSGIIVTAKNRESAALCAALFGGTGNRNGGRPGRGGSGLDKRYLALCAGFVEKGGLIREPLEKRGREQEAETAYTPLGTALLPGGEGEPAMNGPKDYPEDGRPKGGLSLTLLELKPATGRMHQIRRHLAALGCPILGDDKYGDFALNKKLKKTLGLKRLLLHAAYLRLPPPLAGKGLEIRAPLPDYFAALLKRLGLEQT